MYLRPQDVDVFHSLSQSGILQAASGLWLGSGWSLPPRWLDHLWRRRVTTGSSRRNLGLLGGASCEAADVWPNSRQKQSFIVFVEQQAKQSSLGCHRWFRDQRLARHRTPLRLAQQTDLLDVKTVLSVLTTLIMCQVAALLSLQIKLKKREEAQTELWWGCVWKLFDLVTN